VKSFYKNNFAIHCIDVSGEQHYQSTHTLGKVKQLIKIDPAKNQLNAEYFEP